MLPHLRANAEALNIGKSRFLANMSHELRTPLNAIMGFSDIMRERIFGPLPVKYAEYAELIHAAGAHLLDLINDVLDMSKIEASKYELDLEELDTRARELDIRESLINGAEKRMEGQLAELKEVE